MLRNDSRDLSVMDVEEMHDSYEDWLGQAYLEGGSELGGDVDADSVANADTSNVKMVMSFRNWFQSDGYLIISLCRPIPRKT